MSPWPLKGHTTRVQSALEHPFFTGAFTCIVVFHIAGYGKGISGPIWGELPFIRTPMCPYGILCLRACGLFNSGLLINPLNSAAWIAESAKRASRWTYLRVFSTAEMTSTFGADAHAVDSKGTSLMRRKQTLRPP